MQILLNDHSILLGILFFIIPILYKKVKCQHTDIISVLRCAIAAMTLPDFVIFMYYFFVDRPKAWSMPNAYDYALLSIVILGFLVYLELETLLKVRKEDNSAS